MADNVTAEIIAIGTEILLGEIVDTNSVHIARQFRDAGINVFYMTTVGDNRQRIANAIALALSRADIVITCGGLGPTVDDMTRHGVADATGRELVFSQTLYDHIAARFATYKVKMTENNRQQAYLPADAIPVHNPVGTAPAYIVEHGDKCVMSLPGVPREMKYLLDSDILPYLRRRYQLGIIKARILKTAGIGESSLDDMLGHDMLSSSNPTIGLAAHHGIIDIRITAKAATAAEADVMLEQSSKAVYALAGSYIFGEDAAQLESALMQLLTNHDLRLSVLEAGLSGAISEKLGAVTDEETRLHVQQFDHPADVRAALGYDDSATLRDVGEGIAHQLYERDDVAASIVLLSLPDIDEGADEGQATVIAIAMGDEPVKSRIYGFGAKNPLTADWVSRWAMSYVWRSLKDKG